MNRDQLCGLIDELRGHDNETEWIEFKHNNSNPEMIGEYVSALANSACLHRKPAASLRKRFGIDDKNYSQASKIIADTLDAKLIKPYDPTNRSKKHAKYLPFWR